MQCIKTGCHCYLSYNGTWILGDAYECNGVLLIKYNHIGLAPIRRCKNFTILSYSFSWEVGEGKFALVCTPDEYENHGYEGIRSN